MRSVVISCNICSSIKGQANRWLVGWQAEHGYALGDWDDALEHKLSQSVQHFCSETCGLKHQARFLRKDVQPVVESEA